MEKKGCGEKTDEKKSNSSLGLSSSSRKEPKNANALSVIPEMSEEQAVAALRNQPRRPIAVDYRPSDLSLNESVRKGEAGKPAALTKFGSAVSVQANRTAVGLVTPSAQTRIDSPSISA